MEQSDPDYADWQFVLDKICMIPWASLGVKLQLCKEAFQQFPGPYNLPTPPDEKIIAWIEEARKNWEENTHAYRT